MFSWLAFAAAMPPEVAGLPTWVLNGLSVSSLVMFIVLGLGTSRLYTRSQVDRVERQHDREVSNLKAIHDREVDSLRQRYEMHLTRTVELWQGRMEDAVRRESEWREVADQWKVTADMLARGLEPMQETSETMLAILQSWQAANQRRPGGR